MNRDVVKGFVDPVILSVVARGETYGYEIAKYVNEMSGGVLDLKEGTLYPALRRLEAEQLVEGYWGPETSGARRRYYRITPSGRGALERAKEDWSKDKRTLNLFLGEAFAQ